MKNRNDANSVVNRMLLLATALRLAKSGSNARVVGCCRADVANNVYDYAIVEVGDVCITFHAYDPKHKLERYVQGGCI